MDMQKRIVSVAFLIVIIAVFISAIWGKASTEIEQILCKTEDSQESVSDIWNARNEYPFDETEFQLENNNRNVLSTNIISRISKRMHDGINNYVADANPFRIPAVLVQKFWDKSILGYNLTTSLNGTQIETGYGENVVSLQNGQLSYVLPDGDITVNTEKFISFGREMQNEGRNFLLFLSPSKINSSEIAEEYLGCYKDYTTEKESQLTDLLKASNIDFLICDEIKQKIIDGELVFFNTDHHWLPQTALLGCKELAGYMNAHYGYSIDESIYSLENYSISESPYLFLGSQGKKVTEIFASPEPVSVISPKYDSDYTVFISEINETISGTAFDTLINKKAFVDDLYHGNQYAAYGYGDQAYIHIHNNKLSDGKRILIIKKSFADAMVPFLGNMAEDIDVIDLRKFSGSLDEFIAQNDPDTVVIVYSVTAFCQGVSENETGVSARDAFDFR